MRALLVLSLAAVTLAPPMPAADADFKAVVRAIESDLSIRHMRLPLIGFIARLAARGEGVHQLNFAVFDEIHYNRPDAERFDAIMKSAVADRWLPFVRVRSERDREFTYIYLRPDKKHWRMLIASFEPDEAVVVHLKLDPEALMKDFDEPAQAHKHSHGAHGE